MKSRAKIGIERPDVLLAPTVGNRGDCRDIGEDFADRVVPEHDRVGGGQRPTAAERGSITYFLL